MILKGYIAWAGVLSRITDVYKNLLKIAMFFPAFILLHPLREGKFSLILSPMEGKNLCCGEFLILFRTRKDSEMLAWRQGWNCEKASLSEVHRMESALVLYNFPQRIFILCSCV